MTTCCPYTIETFANKEVTTIGYNGEYGEKPKVDVLYLISGVWQQMGVNTNISISPTFITVNHGGLATGIVKVW